MIVGGLITARREGDIVKIGTSSIEILTCDRGRVRIRIVPSEDQKIVIQQKINLRDEDKDV